MPADREPAENIVGRTCASDGEASPPYGLKFPTSGDSAEDVKRASEESGDAGERADDVKHIDCDLADHGRAPKQGGCVMRPSNMVVNFKKYNS